MTQKIIALVEDCCALEEDGITTQTRLKEISLDSLAFVRLVVRLEEEFGIAFEDEDLDLFAWETVGDVVAFTEEKTNGKHGENKKNYGDV